MLFAWDKVIIGDYLTSSVALTVTSSWSTLDEYLVLPYRAYLIDVTVTITVTGSNKKSMDIKLLTIISKNQQSPSGEEVWIHKDR
ncbi:hypothetical protein BHYA_0071g00240 [Botrytis hyacinthi]|uniref:Uncharacterized protein n=1 Tax=Botrytis hyacinthi TaxID=278943 RepID=A0A4Z1GZB2_9HELO|nr:hypothetical protein BHYA_0071g00240 [Botrytis hyacinthi]